MNTELRNKGIKILLLNLLLLFLGPVIFRIAVINQEKTLYIPLLIIAILICFLAVYFLFLGINTIVNSFFKK